MKSVDIITHLQQRGVNLDTAHVLLNTVDNVAYFLLWNLSGRTVGYQRYNPTGSKLVNIRHKVNGVPPSLDMMKYRTYVSNKEIAVYGLETYNYMAPYLFVVEGIFDCIKVQNAGYQCIAVLANDVTVSTISWLRTLPQRKIVIVDNDNGGKFLRKLGDYVLVPPSPYKDVGDMPQEEVNEFISTSLQKLS